MAVLSVTNTYIAGTLAKASEVNQNFTDIINWASGQIQNDNLGTMSGVITWSIATGVKAINISNSGNDGSILVTQNVALNPSRSSIRVNNTAAQTAGDPDVYITMTSASSTVAAFQVDYASSHVFSVKKDRILFPVRTLAQRDAITSPANGSILYVEDSPATRHRGVHVRHQEGWSHLGVPAGVMVPFAGSNVPDGWLLCDGQAVSRTTYATLFAAISTTWGVGDGSTTFNVPDMARRVPVGSGGSGTGTLGNALGNTGGSETHTLITAEMPSHTHTQDAHEHLLIRNAESNSSLSPSNFVARQKTGAGDDSYVLEGHNLTADLGRSAAATATNQSTGGGGAHNNVQPSAVVNYIIKW